VGEDVENAGELPIALFKSIGGRWFKIRKRVYMTNGEAKENSPIFFF